MSNFPNHIKSIEELLKGIHPSDKLQVLEKLAMKIRKANSIRIGLEVDNAKRKYPKK